MYKQLKMSVIFNNRGVEISASRLIYGEKLPNFPGCALAPLGGLQHPQTPSCYELVLCLTGTPLVSRASLAFEAPHNLRWVGPCKH